MQSQSCATALPSHWEELRQRGVPGQKGAGLTGKAVCGDMRIAALGADGQLRAWHFTEAKVGGVS